jgi:Lipocalin-like domain
MKKVYVFAILVLMAFSGCGSDDSPEVNVVDPELVGVWKATSLISSNCENEEQNSIETNMVCVSSDCIEFSFDDNSNFSGRVFFNDVGSNSVGTYSADGGILKIVSGTEILEGAYSISNGQLTFKYEANGCDIELIMNKD